MTVSSKGLIERISGALAAFLGGTDVSGDPAAAMQEVLLDEEWQMPKTAADGAAADAIAVRAGAFIAPYDCELVAAREVPGAVLTADNANNAVLTLNKADTAGGAPTAMAVLTTNVASGNWVARTVKNYTITAANRFVSKGQLVYLTQTKGGTGVVVPVSTALFRFRKV
jgi:hypothetical protein